MLHAAPDASALVLKLLEQVGRRARVAQISRFSMGFQRFSMISYVFLEILWSFLLDFGRHRGIFGVFRGFRSCFFSKEELEF